MDEQDIFRNYCAGKKKVIDFNIDRDMNRFMNYGGDIDFLK